MKLYQFAKDIAGTIALLLIIAVFTALVWIASLFEGLPDKDDWV